MYPDWKDYERQIFHTLSFEYPEAEVIYNLKIKGKSGSERQIDVGIILKKGGKKILGVAECKYIKRKIDLPKIDGLLGMMKDVAASFGIIIAANGYTDPAKIWADRSKIKIKTIPYEFLKDYGFLPANSLADIAEIFHQEVEYPATFCKRCNKTNLYEIKIVRGFCETGWVDCPECKLHLFETRLDGDYRVIKRFSLEDNPSQDEINRIIVDHLIWTRESWDRKYSFEAILFNDYPVTKGKNCIVCHKLFDDTMPGSFPQDYKRRKVCLECFMSRRTLLIDYKKI
jgi:hypothetical protein